jgi:hypothetical protein
MDSFEPLKGYEEKYSINKIGEVYSNKHKKILKPNNDGNGYLYVVLTKNSIEKSIKIHRLLALQFIPNPNNYEMIDHIDRNKLNNSLTNLRWTTRSINSRNYIRPNKSGFPNIYINACGNYKVIIMLNKINIFDKTFKTLDEALSERDWAYDYYGIENPCYN